MKKAALKENLFFSMTWDYLNIFLPSQHQDSPLTTKSYEDGLTIFRRYITLIEYVLLDLGFQPVILLIINAFMIVDRAVHFLPAGIRIRDLPLIEIQRMIYTPQLFTPGT